MSGLRLLLLALSIALLPILAAGQRIGVTHTAPECFPDRCRSVKIVADVTGSERLDQLILYFHAEGSTEDYYTTMRPSNDDPGRYWGYIPVPLEEVEFIDYHIEAVDSSGRRAGTDTFRVAVENGCEAPELTDEERRIARNLVIGFTKPNQKAIPPGFRCGGIVALVNAQGDLMPNEECRQKLAREGDDLLCPIYWKKTALVLAAGVTTGIIIIIDDDGDDDILSPARP